jgi:hypothetical protein
MAAEMQCVVWQLKGTVHYVFMAIFVVSTILGVISEFGVVSGCMP